MFSKATKRRSKNKISEHIQRQMDDLISKLYDRLQKTKVAAGNETTVLWIETITRCNQYHSSRKAERLVKIIDLGDIIGNNPEKLHLVGFRAKITLPEFLIKVMSVPITENNLNPAENTLMTSMIDDSLILSTKKSRMYQKYIIHSTCLMLSQSFIHVFIVSLHCSREYSVAVQPRIFRCGNTNQ